MFNLKIISANLPPIYKPYNLFIRILPNNKNVIGSSNKIYKSKKPKKTNNPEWNQEFLIPFYCFDSLLIEFWHKKMIGQDLIGSVTLLLTKDLFKNDGIQTLEIKTTKTIPNFQAQFNYSISSTLSNLPLRKSHFNPSFPYAYLTYDPPLRANQEEKVILLFQEINQNGTVHEPSSQPENDSRIGPSGVTDVLNYFSNKNIFFYVKSINYSGNVTLNIANKPFPAKFDHISQYFLYFENVTIPVSSEKDVNYSYSLFPYNFQIYPHEFHMEKFSIPEKLNPQKAPMNTNNKSKNKKDIFLSSYDYYHSDPQGIALRNILDSGSKGICPSNLSFHYRYKIEPLKKYSISSAFQYHDIQHEVENIIVAFKWIDYYDNNFFFYTSYENAENLSNFDVDDVDFISQFDDQGQGYIKDKMKFCFSLNKVDPSIKYIAICASSTSCGALEDGHCRVVDEKSKKELMFFKTVNHDGCKSVLVGMFVRNNDDWEFWPCMQYYSVSSPEKLYECFNDFLINKVNKLF